MVVMFSSVVNFRVSFDLQFAIEKTDSFFLNRKLQIENRKSHSPQSFRLR